MVVLKTAQTYVYLLVYFERYHNGRHRFPNKINLSSILYINKPDLGLVSFHMYCKQNYPAHWRKTNMEYLQITRVQRRTELTCRRRFPWWSALVATSMLSASLPAAHRGLDHVLSWTTADMATYATTCGGFVSRYVRMVKKLPLRSIYHQVNKHTPVCPKCIYILLRFPP